jgi:hypothetical protein
VEVHRGAFTRLDACQLFEEINMISAAEFAIGDALQASSS